MKLIFVVTQIQDFLKEKFSSDEALDPTIVFRGLTICGFWFPPLSVLKCIQSIHDLSVEDLYFLEQSGDTVHRRMLYYMIQKCLAVSSKSKADNYLIQELQDILGTAEPALLQSYHSYIADKEQAKNSQERC